MSNTPLIHALCASGYIVFIASVMRYVTQNLGNKPDSFFAPVAFLSILTMSVVVMAYLFFYQPLQLFIDGKRKQAVNLFMQTAGIFAVFTIIIATLVFSGIL